MRILLVPLDDRPVSVELPALVAAIGGARVDTPPAAALSSVRETGDVDALAGWLEAEARAADAAVVSLEGLGFGGLISSRIGIEPIEQVLGRWSALRRLGIPVYASVLVPRTPDSDDAFEEPEYWAEWGTSLHALSNTLGGDASGGDANAVPGEIRSDWLARRLRQHALGLVALGLTADGTIRRLAVGIDDAVPGSLSSEAQRDLDSWSNRLRLADRVTVGPGADETAAVLTARAIADDVGAAPRVALRCADDGGLERVAPYETVPVGETAQNQLRAAGAVPVAAGEPDSAHDAVLVVHAPQGYGDWAVAPPVTTDTDAAARTVDLVRRELAAGRVVAVADVAQPNGADPELVRALLAAGLYARLDGFAAWNTAGNTLGTVAAHLVVAVASRSAGTYDPAAAARLLRLRLIEDAAYMSIARARFRRELGSRADRHDRIERGSAPTARLAELLNGALDELGARYLTPISARQIEFPWSRSFEIRLDPEAGRR